MPSPLTNAERKTWKEGAELIIENHSQKRIYEAGLAYERLCYEATLQEKDKEIESLIKMFNRCCNQRMVENRTWEIHDTGSEITITLSRRDGVIETLRARDNTIAALVMACEKFSQKHKICHCPTWDCNQVGVDPQAWAEFDAAIEEATKD